MRTVTGVTISDHDMFRLCLDCVNYATNELSQPCVACLGIEGKPNFTGKHERRDAQKEDEKRDN